MGTTAMNAKKKAISALSSFPGNIYLVDCNGAASP